MKGKTKVVIFTGVSLASVGCYYAIKSGCLRIYEPKRVVIIGGGVMGASTAWSLMSRKEKVNVTLIDANHPIRGSWHESQIIRAGTYGKVY